MEIYIHQDGLRKGPYTLDQLSGLNITPTTPVWYEGLADWVPASQAPALAPLFTAQPPTPQVAAGAYQQQGAQGANVPTQMPTTYLGWSIFSLICCCLPFGIVAIIYSTQVSSRWNQGDIQGAMQASHRAQLWIILSIVGGVVGQIVFALLYWPFYSAMLGGL